MNILLKSLKFHRLRWTTIKVFFHNPIIKISYIVVIGLPIVIELWEVFTIPIRISETFFQVFYSGILIIISRIIYGIFVPQEISDYSDIHDYVKKLKPDLLGSNPNRKKEIVLTHLDETQNEERSRIELLNKTMEEEIDNNRKATLKNQIDMIVEPLFPGRVTYFLQKEWYISNSRKKRGALIICLLLNLGATLLALWVFYQRVITVIHYNFST